MYLLSSWRRWNIFIKEINWVKYAIKKAKNESKKWAIKKEIIILNHLKWKVSFVPQILKYGDDFFEYKFIEWETLDKIKNPNKEIYKTLLKYSYNLDLLNIEHWELSKPTKNIIISPDKKVYVIDFERWNMYNYNWKNLRWYSQYLLKQWFIKANELKNIFKNNNLNLLYKNLLSKIE